MSQQYRDDSIAPRVHAPKDGNTKNYVVYSSYLLLCYFFDQPLARRSLLVIIEGLHDFMITYYVID